MRKVLVIGPGGSGKSTLAARIGERTGLPVIHLDALYWRAGWVPTPKDEWTRTVSELVTRDAWVMDGNYGGTLDLRLSACDTVIFLDVPRLVCIWRVLKRRALFHRRTRPDMGDRCPERLTWEFLTWLWTYPRRHRPGVLQRLTAVAREKRVVVLTSPAEVERFLAGLGGQTA